MGAELKCDNVVPKRNGQFEYAWGSELSDISKNNLSEWSTRYSKAILFIKTDCVWQASHLVQSIPQRRSRLLYMAVDPPKNVVPVSL